MSDLRRHITTKKYSDNAKLISQHRTHDSMSKCDALMRNLYKEFGDFFGDNQCPHLETFEYKSS